MDLNDLLTSARVFLTEKTSSLEKDVRYCVIRNESTPDWPAPFPALLYCFSVIDLLGALYGGDAKSSTGISERSLNYLVDIMRYPKEKAALMQKIFRHKLVHLAQPNPIQIIDKVRYTWLYTHNDREKHLVLEKIDKETMRFSISIVTLEEDIKSSVFKPNGFLHKLKAEPNLQRNFETAYRQIFEN